MKIESFFMTVLLLGGTSLFFRMMTQGFESALIATAMEWSVRKFRAQDRRRTVNLKVKILATLFSLGLYLTAVNVAQAEPIRAGDMGLPSGRAIAPAQPEGSPLIAGSVTPLVIGGRTLGQVIVYDDPATARPADGFELYDSTGHLVAMVLFDQFGIRRLMVDRALVQGGEELEGIFVWVVDGEPI